MNRNSKPISIYSTLNSNNLICLITFHFSNSKTKNAIKSTQSEQSRQTQSTHQKKKPHTNQTEILLRPSPTEAILARSSIYEFSDKTGLAVERLLHISHVHVEIYGGLRWQILRYLFLRLLPRRWWFVRPGLIDCWKDAEENSQIGLWLKKIASYGVECDWCAKNSMPIRAVNFGKKSVEKVTVQGCRLMFRYRDDQIQGKKYRKW